MAQHHPAIVKAGSWIASGIRSLDRTGSLPYVAPILIPTGTADNADQRKSQETANIKQVRSSSEVIGAIAQARPGDVIEMAPGIYRFHGSPISVARPGMQNDRIILRAKQPGTVILEHEMVEGFLVSAPYWTFENLTIRGICSSQNGCEHAFHVVGGGSHFIARNNTITNFNAHFKINGINGIMPDYGLIEANILRNTVIRNTASAVTPVDLVAASGWVIRRNFISDFIKTGGNKVSFGAFAKGGGSGNRFERNIIICENLLKGVVGHRVGLSLGGGGTGAQFCRDRRCITEQERGVIEANLIASCSDEGIYLNRSASSTIRHNTVINTAGITVRFPESSANVEGNIVDASIRSREDGIVRNTDNLEDSPLKSYIGVTPVRDVYQSNGEFAWRRDPPRRDAVLHTPLDLCGRQRPTGPAYGAFERFSDCLGNQNVEAR
ncbi:NosD domain-containing protein [Noviherbaspirillum sp.]|uniref:NosD domain-containing protein n=1 Tax=Noviherbaspirillum sp. TaxID=1926288 RepID=UPI002DDC9D27|nr:NosD domain-containing protein [Noviherbaspirillum sp.]